MIINNILKEKNMTKYKLSKCSGVPYATVNDICSGKAALGKCSATTVYKLSKALGISMETLLVRSEPDWSNSRSAFEVFKSNVCHRVKDMGEIDFIIHVLETDEIRTLYNRKWYPESLYLLAMVDYLSRENSLPLCKNYNDIRARKLKTTLYPAGVVLASSVMKDDRLKQESLEQSIPEFRRFNIIENEVRDVF